MLSRKLLLLFLVGITILLFVTSWMSAFIAISHTSSKQKRYPRSLIAQSVLRFENRTVADELSRRVRVLCWILTYPDNHWKAMHVKATLGRRCNVLLFMSTKEDNLLPTVRLPSIEGRKFLWGKTQEALKYIYQNFRHDADWFLKTDDDTYVVLENLRNFLSYFDTDDPLFFGAHLSFTTYTPEGYMDGGAGYVLSRDALKRFNTAIERRRRFNRTCNLTMKGAEDIELARCLANLKVRLVNTRDPFGRTRFHTFLPITHIVHGGTDRENVNWYWPRSMQPEQPGFNCCSEYAVTLHRVSPLKMYELEYFIYRMRPYGVNHIYKLNTRKNRYDISLAPNELPETTNHTIGN